MSCEVKVEIVPTAAGISFGTPVVREYVNADPYMGEYEITPTQERQEFATLNKRMTDNLVVNPIPSYYGRIDWSGSIITVY